jgi:hypothetical protein
MFPSGIPILAATISATMLSYFAALAQNAGFKKHWFFNEYLVFAVLCCMLDGGFLAYSHHAL